MNLSSYWILINNYGHKIMIQKFHKLEELQNNALK
jgi:hypothetical protein